MEEFGQIFRVPDSWQAEAVAHLRAGRDVVLHAPTGTGKTFVFELFFSQCGGPATYTVPTRALANDKYAQWLSEGWRVGISTATGSKIRTPLCWWPPLKRSASAYSPAPPAGFS